MLDVLILRFDAPLVSFGASAVDSRGVIQPFPALSMLAGLLGNALGLDHREHERLGRLQERLRYAARCDRPGEAVTDYQTVDLGQPFMRDDLVAWTTRGRLDERKGLTENRRGTHIRERDYHADSVHTVALALRPPAEPPDIDALEHCLREPARPLFIGRKSCLPAAPLLLGRTAAPSLLEALAAWPRLGADRSGAASAGPLSAWWPAEADEPTATPGSSPAETRLLPVTDMRDWLNQIHCGRRLVRHGLIDPPEASGHGA